MKDQTSSCSDETSRDCPSVGHRIRGDKSEARSSLPLAQNARAYCWGRFARLIHFAGHEPQSRALVSIRLHEKVRPPSWLTVLIAIAVLT